ncbi:MAG: choice-of-anchor Q domain-containing protein [Thermoanaerobaculia bacterium]
MLSCRRFARTCFPLALVAGSFVLAPPALAAIWASPASLGQATWTVDILTDENDPACTPGDCSLREAIAAAADGDLVAFALPGSPPWTIALTAALSQLALTNDITITGPGSAALAISGANLIRVMTIQAGASVALSGLTLRNGETKSAGDRDGGCLKVLGQVALSAVRFDSCQAWKGGITSNIAGGDGGGVFVAAGATLSGDLLEFAGDQAGVGGGSASPPTVFAGGRGGGLANAGTATLARTTIANCTSGAGGGPNGPGGDGGGVANLGGGMLLLDSSTLSGNRTGDGATFMSSSGADGRGGGLLCIGDCTLDNVTLSGNAVGTSAVGAIAQGGGLMVTGGTTRLRNVTVAANTATSTGGGIARSAGAIRTRNSVFAGNTGGASPDCAGAVSGVVSEGFNLIRVNNGCASSFSGTDQEGTSASPLEPLLGALAGNGGPTATHAPASNSPAIDHGDGAGCQRFDPFPGIDEPMSLDQRGELRPTDGDGDTVAICDVGAFEIAQTAPVTHALAVVVSGAGSGSVTSAPAGIDCPGDCGETFILTQNVALSATPAPGSFLSGWSGDCAGTGACAFTMSTDRSVTATFGLIPVQHLLSVAILGAGSVTSSPGGIDCPGDCSESFAEAQSVTLTPVAAADYFFTGWVGDCSGTGGCAVVMSVDRTVSATFDTLVLFRDGFASGETCHWTASVGGPSCPP